MRRGWSLLRFWLLAAALLALVAVAAACTPAPASAPADAGSVLPAQAAASPDAGDAATSPLFTGVVAPQDAGPPDESIPASNPGELTTRGKHLLEAIAHDTPDLATDIVFPRDAYSLSRDSADPGKQWDKRITAAFQKDVHTLHKRIKMAETAQFISFEIGHSVTQITPKKKEWKKPLWKVRHSKLSFSVQGKVQRIEIDEMTSWRGAWYVTKLR
jgi:hypothetical protein